MAVYTGGRVVPSLINKDVFGFADAQLESEYRQQWLQSSLVQLRIALLLAAAMIAAWPDDLIVCVQCSRLFNVAVISGN